MNLFKIITYQLYLLQLENYELGRYFRLLFKKGFWPKGEQRKQLVWTAKAKALFLTAVALHLLIVIALIFWSPIIAIAIAFILFTIYCLLFTTALLILSPLDFLLKQIVIARARSIIRDLSIKLDPGSEAGMTQKGIKIIGIAGSYGKTTMKEVLGRVLGVKYKVLSTPESVNTPVGISRWILKNLDSSVQILIVEMGEHYRGDIEDICNIVKPDISVVTGINESHLERMKSMDTIISTVFEIVSSTKSGGMVVLNGDDERVKKHYKEYVWPDHFVEIYKNEELRMKNFDTDALAWDCEIENVGKVKVNLLGEYVLGDVDAAVKIAQSLGMTGEEIKKGIESIKPIKHRLEPIRSAGDILVIDDAYNGNPDGVKEAIKVLSRFSNRRKVFITPGLVEMGKAFEEVHRQIGKELAGVADVVMLIKNSVTSEIELGIMNYESSKKSQIFWFETVQQAHSSLSTVLKPGDVVVFQNDWGDQYT